MNNTALFVNNLSGGYNDKLILDNISFSLSIGSFTALCGPNGAGKTTIIKYLVKQNLTDSASIFIFNNDIKTIKQSLIPQYISYVGQNLDNNYDFTVREMVELGKCSNLESKVNVEDALKLVGIYKLKDKKISYISSGEFQLMQICRAMSQDAKIFILDEPVSNLDPYHQIQIMEILRELHKKEKTILCILHDLNMVLRYCTDCILIKDGKIYNSGKTCEIVNLENIRDVYNINAKFFNLDHDHRQITFYSNQYSPLYLD